MSYKKVGAIRFVKLGRFGFSFWIKKPATVRVPVSSKAGSPDCWAILRQGV